MSMIRKIIPVSLYDIPGLEGWLEEQASQGLFPTSLGSWAVFEDRGLPGTRFRLDPFANRTGEGLEPTEEKLELYRQAGWEYAFRVGRAYFLFYTTDPQAPELFSDHQSQWLSLNRLVKDLRSYRRRKIVLWSLLGILFLAALFLGFSGMEDAGSQSSAGRVEAACHHRDTGYEARFLRRLFRHGTDHLMTGVQIRQQPSGDSKRFTHTELPRSLMRVETVQAIPLRVFLGHFPGQLECDIAVGL